MSNTTSESLTTVETAKDLGLLPEEFEKIKEIMGRIPNFNELSIYSVMWSEHCSYKNSIKYLKKLPRSGKHLLVEAGEENAGLVDIGNGLGCAFKIESHNHPSALEPYQGAATGVGGIHRDIFTMGARPIAALNSLRFGDLKNNKTKHLLKGVVKGIGDYGNAFGVPTVAGEVYFDACYQTNPLVNAMSVGIVKKGETVSATSYGIGNPVYIVGSSTGKDGIAGAAFASKEITADSINDLPAVQVGDPFQEKLLLEATLEVIKTGAVIGMQDMGAAGITCSTSEMSAKGEHGMNIWLDKVPTRQQNMKPWEILLSESQERMLIVVEKGKESLVENVFDKWDLHCAIIGEVIAGNTLNYFMNGELVASVPAQSLVLGGGAPVYDKPYSEPAYFQELKKFDINTVSIPSDLKSTAQLLIQTPNIASKRWVYEQYDSMVGITNTSINGKSDAAVIRIEGTDTCLALTVDCNSRYIYADPYVGAMIAVSEAARNITCSGAIPSAITNCLNFGNPNKPEVYWTFVEALKGMGEACLKFDTPVTGGNVSFYNQSNDGGAVFPTPTIGMIGTMKHIDNKMTLHFKNEGDFIYLLGDTKNDLNSSQYLVQIHGIENSSVPYFNLDEEFKLQQTLHGLNEKKLVQSMHDISEGGLFIALLESAMSGNKGFEICYGTELREDVILFGESQSRVIISIQPEQKDAFENFITNANIPFSHIGKVTKDTIQIKSDNWGKVAAWAELYNSAIEKEILA